MCVCLGVCIGVYMDRCIINSGNYEDNSGGVGGNDDDDNIKSTKTR